MNTTAPILTSVHQAEDLSESFKLIFVEDAEYEFVGGGAASTNGM